MIGLRRRYEELGVDGLADAPRPGQPRTVARARVLTATLEPPRKSLGRSRTGRRGRWPAGWGVSATAVLDVWREHRVQPWQSQMFKFSTDPELVGKVTDVVGLHLAPPANAVVLCIDEKSQIQARDRTQPMLPMRQGSAERRTLDSKRHGTTTRFAALEIATGNVIGACKPRHRHDEFLAFLKQVARACPGQELHLVMDNYAAHKRVEIRDWLAANPRMHVHFTPTSGSWLNLVEVWFAIIER